MDAVPLPDLVITAADIQVNGTLVEGIAHKINVTVQNKGTVAVTGAVVNTSINGTLLNSSAINVAVGGSTKLILNWTPEAGPMNISVEVDPDDIIEEKYENNNTAFKVVTVQADYDGDGIPDTTDDDDDGDGYLDVWEIFLGSDPLDETDKPLDTDLDGAPDGDANNTQAWMDWDDDDDGVADENDLYPLDGTEWADDDGDGVGNAADDDDDADGYDDADDDPSINDTDNDGLINGLDTDDDNDGVLDVDDAMPFDTDNDGLTNEDDTDDDGDGLADTVEDVNWDGIVQSSETDYLDPDTDGDGIDDGTDVYPLDPNNTPPEPEPKSNLGFYLIGAVVIVVVLFIILIAYFKFFKPEK